MTVAIETRATDELREIPIEELVASLNNPRRTMAGLEDLTASIRESGEESCSQAGSCQACEESHRQSKRIAATQRARWAVNAKAAKKGGK
jgi:hypothetical protein